jgi:uncharacterized protein (DUF736 family)
MIIGTFTQNQDGGFFGEIDTAGLHLRAVVFEAMEKGADYALSAEIEGKCFEIGAAWKKSGEYGEYLSVMIDSPALPTRINATFSLKASNSGTYALRWERRKEKEAA